MLALLGAVLAWLTAPGYSESLSGLDFTEGKIALAFAVVSLLAVGGRAALDKAHPKSPFGIPLDIAVVLLGLAILITVSAKWADLDELVKLSGGDFSIGAGPYLGVFGSLFLMASGGLSVITGIINARKTSNESPQAAAPAGSSLDELEKWADLLERGIITQEEFDAKKKELLGF